MALVSFKDFSYTQGSKLLFTDATFSVEPTDKIAIVGPNGCGKSSLLDVLAACLTQSRPEIAVKQGLRIACLNQQFKANFDHTILEHLYRSGSEASVSIKQYHDSLQAYSIDPTPEHERAFSLASQKMDTLNLWKYEERVTSILNELNIVDLNAKIQSLSGGMMRKLNIAETFFKDVDLLILDEPTNHLDLSTIEWLENMLKQQSCALVMVTHDRYFLDNVCNKILEIDQQTLYTCVGNYESYLEQRHQRYQALEKQESRIQSVLNVELKWLKRGPKARSTKQKARKDRIEALLNRKSFKADDMFELSTADRRLGKKILELKHVTKSFQGNTIIQNFSYTFTKGEKIGVLGPNGVGKSTLMKLLVGEIDIDQGSIEAGVNTEFAYFDQHSMAFDLEKTVFEHVHDIASVFAMPDGTSMSATKFLERFLFPQSMLSTPIGNLSGGERRRLHLVCLLLKHPNFLLLDEPTNDFDIQTLSVLEDFLLEFKGCVLLISHDRFLMDRLVDRLFVFEGNGSIRQFHGNYHDYKDTLAAIKQLDQKRSSSVIGSSHSDQKKTGDSTYHESKQTSNAIRKIERTIERLEKEKEALNDLFLSDALGTENFETTGKKLKEINDSLDEAYEQWERLLEG